VLFLTTAFDGSVCQIEIEVLEDEWRIADWEKAEDVIPTYQYNDRGGSWRGDDIYVGKRLPLETLSTPSEPMDLGFVHCYGESRIGTVITPQVALDILVQRTPTLTRLPASLIARAGIACGYPEMLDAISLSGTNEGPINIGELLELADCGLLTIEPVHIKSLGHSKERWSWVEKLCIGNVTHLYLPDPGDWHESLVATAEHFKAHVPIVRGFFDPDNPDA